MTREDYAELGLRAGLEIHQQLLTEKKLFCRCPAGRYSEAYHAEILRHMRPTLSELGEYDGTALMEFKTKKEIIYQINHQTVCTYEMDDTPPFEINRQALDIALEIAMLLNYKLVGEIHIARKQYLDGSIPTGFQRTTIVGIDGEIPYHDRNIGLIQLGLEEDACREVSDAGHLRVYRTDRLGMPLIEMVTYPDMQTPQEVADVANLLRWSVRSTGKVRTGIGAARQDVNVSIRGGTRIEIKGVPRIPLIPLLIYNEAQRQYSLLKIWQELHRRGITDESFHASSQEVTGLLSRAPWNPIQQALQRNEEIHCVNLKGFNGILSYPTQTGKVFSKEIADRVRVVACLTRLPNILTSESAEETIDSFTWKKIRKAVKGSARDALILVWGNREDVRTGVQEIILRAREATQGIPSETRQALADGTNGFERILPGPDRMYPDTDLPPLEITESQIKKLEKNVPEPVWYRMDRYRKMGIPEHLLIPIASSPRARFFESLTEKYNLAPVQIARYLFEIEKALKRKGFAIERLNENVWDTFFSFADQQPTLLENGFKILETFLTETTQNIETVIKQYYPPTFSKKDLYHIVDKIQMSRNASFNAPEKEHRFLMGEVLSVCRGQIPAQHVHHKLWERIQQTGDENE